MSVRDLAGVLPQTLAAWIFGWGLFGLVTSRNLVHLVMCLGVVQTSTYVLLLGMGYRTGALPPIFVEKGVGTNAVDPVVQALMLTDVVVEATVVALLLALVVRVHKKTQELDPSKLEMLKG